MLQFEVIKEPPKKEDFKLGGDEGLKRLHNIALF